MKVFTYYWHGASQSDVVHNGTGRTVLDNAGVYCPDARSAPLVDHFRTSLDNTRNTFVSSSERFQREK